MYFSDVAENEQKGVMKQVFGDVAVGRIFATTSQQFVVHGSVELPHGLPVALLASRYQLLHSYPYALWVVSTCVLSQDLDASCYADALARFRVSDWPSRQVIVLLGRTIVSGNVNSLRNFMCIYIIFQY